MPAWIQVIAGSAALILALGTVWTKAVRPMAKLITTAEKMLPLLVELTKQLGGTPNAFEILKEIVGQVRTDGGSSLRDVVDRLDTAAADNRRSGEVLKVNVEVVKQLAAQDRVRMESLVSLANRLEEAVRTGSATSLRIEAAASDVADDLAAAHRRADDISPTAPAGAAADAASQGGEHET